MKVVGVIALMFVAAVTGAWAWFHVAPPGSGERYRLEGRRQMPGWAFREEPLSLEVRSILATTNLFNGAFHGPGGERVTVFVAEWDARQQTSMAVVGHTPDVCWVGAGWVPEDVGQPSHVTLSVGPQRARFECRVFSAPGRASREIVLWCTLLGGELLAEGERWATEADGLGDPRKLYATSGRRMAFGHFMTNVKDRRLASGDKQFIRLSVELRRGWEEELDHLVSFASRWLIASKS